MHTLSSYEYLESPTQFQMITGADMGQYRIILNKQCIKHTQLTRREFGTKIHQTSNYYAERTLHLAYSTNAWAHCSPSIQQHSYQTLS